MPVSNQNKVRATEKPRPSALFVDNRLTGAPVLSQIDRTVGELDFCNQIRGQRAQTRCTD